MKKFWIGLMLMVAVVAIAQLRNSGMRGTQNVTSSTYVVPGVVDSTMLKDENVPSTKIQDGQVKTADLANLGTTWGKLATPVQDSILHAYNWKNIKSYGAGGSGATDDLPAIHAALAAGNVIFLPQGTYNIHGPIIIQAKKKVIGFGQQAVIRQMHSGALGFYVYGDSVEISGLKLRGYGQMDSLANGHGAGTGGTAIYYNNRFKGLSIHDNYITQWGGCGMQVMDYSFIFKNRIDSCGNEGIYVPGDHNVITDNYIRDCQMNAIDVTGSGNVVQGNHIHNCGWTYAASIANSLTAEETAGILLNSIVPNLSGIYLPNIVKNNSIDSCGSDGIRAASGVSTGPIGSIVEGNVISDCGLLYSGIGLPTHMAGIWLAAADTVQTNWRIINNTISNQVGDGINLTGGKYVGIMGNTCSGATRDGISVGTFGATYFSQYASISNNFCFDNTRYGIAVAGSKIIHNVITNNTCRENGTANLYVAAGNIDNGNNIGTEEWYSNVNVRTGGRHTVEGGDDIEMFRNKQIIISHATGLDLDLEDDDFALSGTLLAAAPASTDRTIIRKINDSYGYKLELTTAGKLKLTIRDKSNTYTATSTTTYSGEFRTAFMVICIKDSKTFFLKNGITVDEVTGTGTLASVDSVWCGGKVYIGADSTVTGSWFNGELADIRLFRFGNKGLGTSGTGASLVLNMQGDSTGGSHAGTVIFDATAKINSLPYVLYNNYHALLSSTSFSWLANAVRTNIIANGSDWTDTNADSLPNNWAYINGEQNSTSRVAGNGFSGLAWRNDSWGGGYYTLYYTPSTSSYNNKYLALSYKRRNDLNSYVYLKHGQTTQKALRSITAATGNCVKDYAFFYATESPGMLSVLAGTTSYIEIDDLSLKRIGEVASWQLDDNLLDDTENGWVAQMTEADSSKIITTMSAGQPNIKMFSNEGLQLNLLGQRLPTYDANPWDFWFSTGGSSGTDTLWICIDGVYSAPVVMGSRLIKH